MSTVGFSSPSLRAFLDSVLNMGFLYYYVMQVILKLKHSVKLFIYLHLEYLDPAIPSEPKLNIV